MLASGAFMGNPPGSTEVLRGDVDGDNRVLIPLFLASAFLFFIAYQLFGVTAAAAVFVLFCFLTLAAHRIKVTRSFPFLHMSLGTVGRGGGGGVFVGTTTGLDATAISVLPAAFRYKRDQATAGWAQCAICMGLVLVDEVVRRLPACGHLFHAGCIDEWLHAHSTCPLCRVAVCVVQPELPV